MDLNTNDTPKPWPAMPTAATPELFMQTNLYAFTEPTPTDGYPGYVSLNRQPDESVTLTVRSPGNGGTQVGTLTLPRGVMLALADSLKFDGAQFAGSGGWWLIPRWPRPCCRT